MSQHLILAGGGHSHALLLRRWAMQPRRRPKGLITLVNRQSTALYSGMVPGLVAGLYPRNSVAIDLRQLTDQACVAFIVAEITGLDPVQKQLHLQGRPSLTYDRLSLNVGSVTTLAEPACCNSEVAIKPLEPALGALHEEEHSNCSESAVQVRGSGLAAIELAFAIRHRWPHRSVALHAHLQRVPQALQRALKGTGIDVHSASQTSPCARDVTHDEHVPVPALSLRCTGSQAPTWLAKSGLPVDGGGRVLTQATMEVIGHPGLFAAGDCAVIDHNPRPPSGVWAVRAAKPLARNLEASSRSQPLRQWRPQGVALQLLGGFQSNQRPTGWALWGAWLIGPHPWLWRWKQHIDRQFMARFRMGSMELFGDGSKSAMLCRGCAAKLPAAPLEAALKQAGFKALGSAPEDANPLPHARNSSGQVVLQSVDGFPALISDPWLNGRLTALHACSDLWACGATVDSAQTVVTLPRTYTKLQQELLSQTLAGVRSVLEPQGAQLIGGHTLEARSPSTSPLSLDVQLIVSVQGSPAGDLWTKRGVQAGDQLLLSRPLGTGVIFAAAMAAASAPEDIDHALVQMASSQHRIVDQLRALEEAFPGQLHAATDITGFGLLGHLGEMLGDIPTGGDPLQVTLEVSAIPSLPGALALLTAGHASSLAPANRRAWQLLDPHPNRNGAAAVTLNLGSLKAGGKDHRALLELLVDPQTCGPLLISAAPSLAEALLDQGNQGWRLIGNARTA